MIHCICKVARILCYKKDEDLVSVKCIYILDGDSIIVDSLFIVVGVLCLVVVLLCSMCLSFNVSCFAVIKLCNRELAALL